jgi:hypothetical protein
LDSLQDIKDTAVAEIEDAADTINDAANSNGAGSQGGTADGKSLLDSLKEIQDAALAGLGDGTGANTGNQPDTSNASGSTGTGTQSGTGSSGSTSTTVTEDTTTDSPPPAVSEIEVDSIIQTVYNREKSSLESEGRIIYEDIYYYQYIEDGSELAVFHDIPLKKTCSTDEGKMLASITINACGLWNTYELLLEAYNPHDSLDYLMTTYKGVPAAIFDGSAQGAYRYEIVLFDPAIILNRHPERPHCGLCIYSSGELTGLIKQETRKYADLALEIGYSRGIFQDYDPTAP